MYKIIDAHCHVYPEKIAIKASQATGTFYDLHMSHDGTVASLIEQGNKAGISHYIINSVATTPAQVSSINTFIANEVSKHSNMTGLGTLHPESTTLESDIQQLIDLGLKGVKLHPDIQGFKLDDYRFLKMYELCEEKLPFLIHTGDKRYDFSNPNRLIPILETYDKLTVIGAHFGGWSIWKEASQQLYKYKNLYVDCSSSMFALSPDETVELIHKYGSERVLFGTDYPMWTPEEELTRFLNLDLTEEERESILHKNAEKLFGICL